MIERITPPGVPTPRGPYTPAVRAGAFAWNKGSMRPVPAKYSAGPLLDGCERVLLMSIFCPPSLGSPATPAPPLHLMSSVTEGDGVRINR